MFICAKWVWILLCSMYKSWCCEYPTWVLMSVHSNIGIVGSFISCIGWWNILKWPSSGTEGVYAQAHTCTTHTTSHHPLGHYTRVGPLGQKAFARPTCHFFYNDSRYLEFFHCGEATASRVSGYQNQNLFCRWCLWELSRSRIGPSYLERRIGKFWRRGVIGWRDNDVGVLQQKWLEYYEEN
jgi:hypothetical protein